MGTKLISIVIPVFNAEKTLDRCMESIYNQTYKNYEVILVDDGSTDYSGKICDYHAKNNTNIRVFHLQNAGVSHARNVGVEYAQGDYLCFLDSDDELEAIALQEFISTIEEYECDLVQGATRKIYQDGTVVPEEQEQDIRVLNCEEAMSNYIKASKPIVRYAVWGKVFRRDVIGDCRFANKKNHEDVEFMAKIIDRCKKIVYTPTLVYKTYILEGSLSHRQYDQRKIEDQLSTHNSIINLLNNNIIYSELVSYALRAKAISIMDMIFDVYNQKNENWKQMIEKLQFELRQTRRVYQFEDLPHKIEIFLCCFFVNLYIKIRKLVCLLNSF